MPVSSLTYQTESVTKSFKRFRNRGFTNGPADYHRNTEGTLMTAAQRDHHDRQVARRNRDDLSVLLELRDIEDELSTILRLFDQQDTVITSMKKYFDQDGCGKTFLDVAQVSIDEYRTQIGEMKENSHLAQKAVETLLDLKQKQANVDEMKLARWQAEATQNQSRSVMVFTIFTVIFLPLSFFTSLFGINAREWSGVNENLPLSEMFEIGAPTSFAIIAIALLLGFSEKLRGTVAMSHKIGAGLIRDFLLHPVMSILRWDSVSDRMPSRAVPGDSTMRRRFDHYLGNERHSLHVYDDFWQRRQNESTPLAGLERTTRRRESFQALDEGNTSPEKFNMAHVGRIYV